MNTLPGTITRLETDQQLSLVTVQLGRTAIELRVLVIEGPERADYLQQGQSVALLFKETEVILAAQESPATSIINRLPATVTDYAHGALLSQVNLSTAAGPVKALCPTVGLPELNLESGKAVTLLLKANELILAP